MDIVITADGDGHRLLVEAPGFTFTGADVFDPVPGEGHAHLYVNGDLMTMVYRPDFRVPRLDPGTYELEVTLSTNDHLEYAIEGEILSAVATLVVGDSDTAQDVDSSITTESPEDLRAEIVIDVQDGTVRTDDARVPIDLGATVVLTVTSDVADEVHIHGYDHTAHLHANELASIEFIADVPGIFEIELEASHLLLIELEVG